MHILDIIFIWVNLLEW